MSWPDENWLKGLVVLMLIFIFVRELREDIRIEQIIEDCRAYTDHYYGDDNGELEGYIRC